MILIDAHCHLEPNYTEPWAEVISRARAAGLVHAIVVGQFQQPGDFGTALAAAQAHPDFLTATMGIHPHDAAKATNADFAQLEALCARADIAAVGEAGLDYYYDHSPRPKQLEVFRWQCQLAKRVNKPLVVHVRDAHDECAQILREEQMSDGMIHCFSGDQAAARAYLDLGFHLSISGMVTYKKTEGLQDAVRFAPMDRLMVETDSPFLTPVPYRGKRNEPMRVVEVAKRIAELKGLDADAVAEKAARNCARLFRLPESVFAFTA
jgi:TatD DNase family protein